MSDDSIKIKIDASIDGEEADLSVSELGALFTAINRCLNQIPPGDGHKGGDTPKSRHFDAINYEPAFVELKVSSIKRGCVELEVFATALKFLNDLPEPHRSLILGALGHWGMGHIENLWKAFRSRSKAHRVRLLWKGHIRCDKSEKQNVEVCCKLQLTRKCLHPFRKLKSG